MFFVLFMMSFRELEFFFIIVGNGIVVVFRLIFIFRYWFFIINRVSYWLVNFIVIFFENWGILLLLVKVIFILYISSGFRVIVLVGEMVRVFVDWRVGVFGVKVRLKVIGVGLLLMIGIYFFFFGVFLVILVVFRFIILCLGFVIFI